MTYNTLMLCLIGVLVAGAVFAAPPSEVAAGGDTLTLEPHPVHAAQLVYDNSARSLTAPGEYRLCLDAVCVTARLSTSKHSPREWLVVTPDDGYLAVPSEAIVPDGHRATILIILPMY